VVVIGGDGSFRADIFSREFDIPFIGIKKPGTKIKTLPEQILPSVSIQQ